MAERDWVASHLFLAVPQVFANQKTLRHLRDIGVISQETYTELRSSSVILTRWSKDLMDAKSIVRRILAIDSALLDEDLVNLLRLGDLISKERAHQFRLMIRANVAIKGRRSDATIFTRYARLFGVGYSEETINLMRAKGMINTPQADFFRTMILGSRVTVETLPRLIHANNFLHMMSLLGDGLIDPRTIRAMRYSGMVSPRTAGRLEAAILMGRADWRNFQDAKRVEGLAQRLAYTVSGSFNHETITFLRRFGIINRKEELALRIPVHIGLLLQRRLQEKWTARRFRPRYGESPITTYARASKKTNAELLSLLARAAKDAQKTANKLDAVSSGKIGGAARSAQLRNVTKELHDQMQNLWEGNGYLTIFGQHEAAQAAIDSTEGLMKRLLGRLPTETQFMMGYVARNGVDSYISRRENLVQLSRRVYKNQDLYTGRVNKRINFGLLQGKSAAEIALDVSRFIKPGTPGGVSYAAMRLARTEINNAFHITTIRYTREMPWVQAYKWNLSGSHPNSRSDICNQYAESDHGTGNAGEFKKSEVPGKPHPNCLCYVTVVDIGEDRFFQLYSLGYYNRYLSQNVMGDQEARNSWLHDNIQNAFSRTLG